MVVMKNAYVLLFVAIVAEVAATSFLKAAQGFTRPIPSIASVVGYGVAFYFLSLTLGTIPTGVAYAIWSGVGIVLISIVGWAIFGQSLDLPALGGMALIASGVIVINLFSKSAAH
jgi:small multidrug resistance pump